MEATEQIKNRINIVDLMREYIELKKAGANWKALCPFHSEKTPSLMISEDKQIWHCFGCNEGGDIFGFVMRMEGIDFTEALRLLAKKAGVALERQDPAKNSQKTKLMDILEAAASFFSAELSKSQIASNYIKKRELKEETVKQFRLGFSPQEWDGLLKFLDSKNFRSKDAALAGLLIEKDGGGFYDRFRGRVMFPIFNHYGNIVGFTARVLPEFDDGKSGKYINTPETQVYKKSEILYGLNFGKQDIKKEGCVVVVEGNMDVIALHQAGFKNVVATSGTALTNEQLMLMKRFTENMIVCFDADSAGVLAALRGIDLALSHGFNVKVFGMPKDENGEPVAKDPDELIKKFPELWKKAISSPKHIIEFYIAANIAKFNLGDPHENARFCKIILGEIQKIKNSVERSLWIKKMADVSGVAERDLREMLLSGHNGGRATVVQNYLRQAKADDDLELKYLSLILSDTKYFFANPRDIAPEMIKDEEAREFYINLIFYYNTEKDFSIKGFENWLGQSGKNSLILDKLSMLKDKDHSDTESADLAKETRSLALYIKNNYFKEQKEFLIKEMKKAEETGDREKKNDLMNKFKNLNV